MPFRRHHRRIGVTACPDLEQKVLRNGSETDQVLDHIAGEVQAWIPDIQVRHPGIQAYLLRWWK